MYYYTPSRFICQPLFSIFSKKFFWQKNSEISALFLFFSDFFKKTAKKFFCVASEKSARNTENHFSFAEKQWQDLQKINKLNGSFLPDETHRAAVPIVFEFGWVFPPPDNIAA